MASQLDPWPRGYPPDPPSRPPLPGPPRPPSQGLPGPPRPPKSAPRRPRGPGDPPDPPSDPPSPGDPPDPPSQTPQTPQIPYEIEVGDPPKRAFWALFPGNALFGPFFDIFRKIVKNPALRADRGPGSNLKMHFFRKIDEISGPGATFRRLNLTLRPRGYPPDPPPTPPPGPPHR